MERQRSFSLKSKRFLLFLFTISSSLFFLCFFSIWIIKSTPSFHQETHLHIYRKPLLSPVALQTLTGFSRNYSFKAVENSVSIDILFNGSELLRFPVTTVKKGSGVSENGGERINGSLPEVTENAAEELVYGVTEAQTDEGVEEKDLFEKTEVLDSGGSESVLEEKMEKDYCDITKGKWVREDSYPLYSNLSCPFIDEGFGCESNGRFDKDYMKLRWKPHDCDIPRFNATTMLELIRGKRLVFVGDSINRNQWESMLCLLMGAISDPSKVYETRGRKITKEKGNYSFRFADYKCTVEYYVTHFLVHESKARIGGKRRPTLRIDAIDRASSRWRGADVLIFNTAHWWSHHKTKAGINYYQEGNQVHPRLDASTAFTRALTTWGSWVDKHINPKKTHVFFRSSSPSHFSGGQWNSGGHCKEATLPLNETSSFTYPEKNRIVDQVINQMRTPVTILNVTGLSGYRIDGHPSIYGRKLQSRSSSREIQDCSHWCLPGVPDTWNELMYFYLQSNKRN